MEQLDKFNAGCLGWAVSALAAVVLSFGIMIASEGWEREGWPSTNGVVTHSSVRGETSRGTSEVASTVYSAKIEYKFEVDGEEFTGDRVRAARTLHSSEKPVERFLKRYPVGQTVRVFYSPEYPARQSILRPASDERGLILGGILLLLGVAIVLGSRIFGRVSGGGQSDGPAVGADESPSFDAPRPIGPCCPKCDPVLALDSPTVGEYTCRGCRGDVLTGEETTARLAAVGVDMKTATELLNEMGTPLLKCPLCPSKMHQGPIRGETIDLCLRCGALWLDAGELNRT